MKNALATTKRHAIQVVALCFVFAAASSSATEFTQKLTAPDFPGEDNFGISVALAGDTALVGSWKDDDNGTDSGSAYLFDTTTGSLLHKLTAPDGAADDLFGWSVALAGDTALVGSYQDDDNGTDSGSAYLFDATTGNLLHKLTAPDGAVNDWFGRSVALAGDTALVGSNFDEDNGTYSGSAYLFDTTTGNLLHKLTAPDGAVEDRFGHSVALAGDMALVGSYLDDDNGPNSGSAYLYDTTTGNLLHKLTAPDGSASDWFGRSVALAGDMALVGSSLDDDTGPNSGSAYLFDTTTGNLLHKLTAQDGGLEDRFGHSVALTGDMALVGSYRDNQRSGSAYLFDANTGRSWHKLTAPDRAPEDFFGWSVALAGDTALVGSWQDNNNKGSAYLFRVPERVPEPGAGVLCLLGLLGGRPIRR